jgi:hypothetical protein
MTQLLVTQDEAKAAVEMAEKVLGSLTSYAAVGSLAAGILIAHMIRKEGEEGP